MKRERQIYNTLTLHLPRLDEKNRAQRRRARPERVRTLEPT